LFSSSVLRSSNLSKHQALINDSVDFLFTIDLHLFKKSSKVLYSQFAVLSFSINSQTSKPTHFVQTKPNLISFHIADT
jgi:hypothetical protein